MEYEEYLEARETLWQSLPSDMKENITKTKQELQRRKQIMQRERLNPQIENKDKKVSAAYYWQKYDELCNLEEQAGLTEVAKIFCKAQALKIKK